MTLQEKILKKYQDILGYEPELNWEWHLPGCFKIEYENKIYEVQPCGAKGQFTDPLKLRVKLLVTELKDAGSFNISIDGDMKVTI